MQYVKKRLMFYANGKDDKKNQGSK